MSKILANILFLALFVSASAFTSVNPVPAAKVDGIEKKDSKKLVFNLTVVQPVGGIPTIVATWNNGGASTGPFIVTITNMTCTQPPIVFAPYWGTTITVPNLWLGCTYRVRVQDAQNFQDQFITLI